MTEKEIDEMEAGRKLDAAVHVALYPRHNVQTFESLELALWHYCDGSHEKQVDCKWQMIPHYSTDIGAAWLVVEKMQAYGDIQIECVDGKWWISTSHDHHMPLGAEWSNFTSGDTAPLAICRAALKVTDCHKITTDEADDLTQETVQRQMREAVSLWRKL